MTSGQRRIVCVAANPSIDRLYEVERLTDGTIHRPLDVVVRPGGKGLNVARAAVALGAQVSAIAIVAGHAGDWIVEGLAELGVDARSVRSEGETRTCVTILDRASGGLTEVYEPGGRIDREAWAALEEAVRLECSRGDVGVLTLSGSLPVGAPEDGFARLAHFAEAAGVPVFADIYGPPLAAVLRERPAVVKVNATEASEATAIAVVDLASAGEAGRVLHEQSGGDVVITLGVAGAVVVSAEGVTRLDPPADVGRYPVGSGDAFLAGLATAFVDGLGIVDAARIGMIAATANAHVPGAGDLDAAVLARLGGGAVRPRR